MAEPAASWKEIQIRRGAAAIFPEVLDQARALRANADLPDDVLARVVPAISGWAPSGHLEHLAVAGRSTLPLMEMALSAPAPVGVLNASGHKLFALGAFPRGQAQAPEFSRPRGVPFGKLRSSLDRYLEGLANLSSRLAEIEKAPGTAVHPLLGSLTALEWLLFLKLHQEHHLRIIAEILAG